MTVYVDPLFDWGWVMRGRVIKSCHMLSDSADLEELHALAQAIGMKRSWFQDKAGHPHYDLTASRRLMAIGAGAREVSFKETIALWSGAATSTGDQHAA